MKHKVTFIVRSLTDEALASVSAMNPQDAFAKLASWASGDLRHAVSRKDGNGSFSDRVDINRILRDRSNLDSFTVEPRKGYKLVTFPLGAA